MKKVISENLLARRYPHSKEKLLHLKEYQKSITFLINIILEMLLWVAYISQVSNVSGTADSLECVCILCCQFKALQLHCGQAWWWANWLVSSSQWRYIIYGHKSWSDPSLLLVNYIRINNNVPLFSTAMCQACLSACVSSAVQSTYPCVLVHCPAAV